MSASNGRPRTCGQIPDSATDVETLGQLLEFRDLAKSGWILDTGALYATIAFSRDDIGIDARLYCEDIRSHLPTDALRVIAGQVIGSPIKQNIVSMGNQCRGWLYTVDAAKADRKTIAVVQDVIQRSDLYCAAYGNAGACARAAVHAYENAHNEKNFVLHARYVAVALGLLARSQRLVDGNKPIIPMTDRAWLHTSLTKLKIGSDALGEHVHAAKVFAGEHDDEADPVRDMLSDLPDIDEKKASDVDIQDDLDALLDAAIARQPVIEQQPLPAVMVLQSLSHLPEHKSSSSPNPRLEYAPLAGVYVPLAETPDLQVAARTLVSEMPWAEDVIRTILTDSVGSAVSRVRNTLLLGKPGSGKTRLARRIGELLGMQPTVIPAAGAADASFAGTNRQWSTARAAVPTQTIRRTGIANPLLILDELEKAGDGTHNGNLLDSVIPFLETESAKRFHDPYLECAVALSHVGYIGTANSTFRLSSLLLDRFRVLEVPQPRKHDLSIVAHTIVAEIRAERGEDAVWCPDLNGDELEILARQWRGGSLRPLRRMIEVLLSGRISLAPRH